ncbi:unnamed protein product, partial [Arabidopsis halleri]
LKLKPFRSVTPNKEKPNRFAQTSVRFGSDKSVRFEFPGLCTCMNWSTCGA